MTQIGTVKAINGVAKAVNADGESRVLVLGDPIFEGEVVSTVGTGSSIQLSFDSGRELALRGDEKSLLDETVYAKEEFANADVTAAQQALLDGGELPADATAAGEEAPVGNDGFVPAYTAARSSALGDVDTYNIGTDALAPVSPAVNDQVQVNEAPIAFDDVGSSVEEGTGGEGQYDAPQVAIGNVLGNDTDDGLPNPSNDLDVTNITSGNTTNAAVLDADGNYTLVGEFGTLVLNAETGEYAYTVDDANPTVNAQNINDTLTENFNYTVSDGLLDDSANLTITINGANDAPIAVNDTTGETSGLTVVQGEIVPRGVAGDGPGTSIDAWSFTHSGGPLTIDVLTEQGEYYDDGGLDINGDGELSSLDSMIHLYSVDSEGNRTQYFAENDDVYDEDYGDGSFGNDGSTNTEDSFLDLSDLPAGNYVFEISNYEFNEEEIGQAYQDDNSSSSIGHYQITFDGNVQITSVPELGKIVSVASTDETSFVGNNAVEANETDVAIAATGNVLDNDTDVDNTHAELSVVDVDGTAVSTLGEDTTITGLYGTLTMHANGTFSYSADDVNADVNGLNIGESLNDVFTYTVSDNEEFGAKTDTANLTITIDGTNDAPVITSEVQSGTIVEDANNYYTDAYSVLSEGPNVESTNGTLTFNDVDVNDSHTVTYELKSAMYDANNAEPISVPELGAFTASQNGTDHQEGAIDWNFTVDNADLQYLANGETIDLVYTVTVTDLHGKTDTQDLTITIEGTNDQPIISDINLYGSESSINVAVFDNGSYVDTRGGSGAESDNMQAALTSQGHTFIAFTDDSESGFTTALAGVTTLVMPEQERGSYENLSVGAQNAIHDFVNDGGTLVINSSSGHYDTSFLNGLFGWSLTDGNNFSSDGGHPFNQTLDALGTPYEGASSTLPDNNGTYTIDTDSLPAGALNLYADDSGNTAMFSVTVGGGTVVFLAYDWFDASPVGSLDGGWLDILDMAVSSSKSGTVYETHDLDQGEDGDTIDDGINTFTGTLSVSDLDVSDTHTFRIVDETVAISDPANAGVTIGDDVSVSIYAVDGNGDRIEDGDTTTEVSQWKYEINGDFNALAAGETATVTFQYVADDGHGFGDGELPNESSVSDPATITVTITGTNDQPIVSDVDMGAITEASLTNETIISDGTYIEEDYVLTVDAESEFALHNFVTDADTNDTHTFAVAEDTNITVNGEESTTITSIDVNDVEQSFDITTGNISVNVNENGSFDITSYAFNRLGEGESVTLTFDFVAIDTSAFQNPGESNTSEPQTVTVTINGTNDQPVIYDVSLSQDTNTLEHNFDDLTVTDGDNSIVYQNGDFTGQILARVSDEDANDSHQFVALTNIEATIDSENYNTDRTDSPLDVITDPILVSLNADGTFNITNKNFDNLAEGESVTFSFYTKVTDGTTTAHTGNLTDSALTGTSEGALSNVSAISEPFLVTMTITGTNDQPIATHVVNLDVSNPDGFVYENPDEQGSTLAVDSGTDGILRNDETPNSITGTLSAIDDDFNDAHQFSILDMVAPTAITPDVANQTVEYTDGLGNTANVEIKVESSAIDVSQIDLQQIILSNNNVSGETQDSETNFELVGDFTGLAAGETADVTFAYNTTDNQTGTNGESAVSETKTVTITVMGTNDQPVVDNVNLNGGIEVISTFTAQEDSSPIADNLPITTSTIEVTNTSTGIADLNVNLNLSHTWVGDLIIKLTAPDGTQIDLYYDDSSTFGSSGNNFVNTTFDDEAVSSITAAAAPFTGSFQPIGDLSVFDNMDLNGEWTLSIQDTAGGDEGFLTDWSLIFTTGGETVIFETNTDAQADVLYADDTQAETVNTLGGTLAADDQDINDNHTFYLKTSGDTAVDVIDNNPSATMNEVNVQVVGLGDVNSTTLAAVKDGLMSIELLDNDATDSTPRSTDFELKGDFTSLAAGEQVTVSFEYYAVDTSANQTTGETNQSEPKVVTMTITGTNDQPIVENIVETYVTDSDYYETSDDVNAVGVDDTNGESLDDLAQEPMNTLTGTLRVSDEDISDTHTFDVESLDTAAITRYYAELNETEQVPTATYIATQDIGYDGGTVTVALLSNDFDVTQAEEGVPLIDLDTIELSGLDTSTTDVSSAIDFALQGNFSHLAAGEKVTVLFKYTSTDDSDDANDGAGVNESNTSEEGFVSLVVMGTNDQPIIESTEVKQALETDLTDVTYGANVDLDATDLASDVQEGSALKVVVDTAAGDTVAFNWAFTSDDTNYDTASVIVDGVIVGTVDTQSNNTSGTFTTAALSAGEHTITLVVVNDRIDDVDSVYNAHLNISNIVSDGVIIATETFGAVTGDASLGYDLSANSDLPAEDLAAFIDTTAVSYENAHLSGNLDAENLVLVSDNDDSDGYTYVPFSDKIVTNVTEDTSGSDPLMNTPIRVSLDADGNYDVISTSFDKLGEGESVTITFDIQVQDTSGAGTGTANDETSFSELKTITMVIDGTNDQPVIASMETMDAVIEADLTNIDMFGAENVYKVITQADLLAQTTISDEDVNDSHTLEFANSSVLSGGVIISQDALFEFNTANANGAIDPLNSNGVIQVTQGFLDLANLVSLPINAAPGDFIFFGDGLNNMGLGETATLEFKIVANDGTSGLNGGESNLSAPQTVRITIEGTNDQPTVTNIVVAQAEAIGAGLTAIDGTFVGADEDSNDTLAYGVVSMDSDTPISEIAGSDFVRVEGVRYDADGNGAYEGLVDIAVKLESGSEVDLDKIDITGITVNGGTFTLEGDFNALPAGEDLIVKFQYNATDDSGAGAGDGVNETAVSDTQVVTVTVTGTNDVAEISVGNGQDAGGVAEDTVLHVDGQLGITDLDAGEAIFDTVAIASSENTTAYGTFSIDENGAWSYDLINASAQELNEGQTVTESYEVFSKDGTDSQVITVTIIGNEDPSFITVEASDSDTGIVKEDTDVSTETDTLDMLLASGTLSISDVDMGDAPFSTIVTPQGTTLGALSIDADGAWSYEVDNTLTSIQALGFGQHIEERFEVSSADSLMGDTQIITITINGTNDVPTAVAEVNSVNEDATVSGTIAFADIDGTVTVAITDGNETPTGLTLFPNGNYIFDASDYDYLSAGQPEIITVPLTVTDNDGATVETTLTITVTGTDDAPDASNVMFSVSESTLSVVDTDGSNPADENTLFEGTLPAPGNDELDTHTYSLKTSSIDTTGAVGVVDAAQTAVTVNSNGTYSVENPTFNNLSDDESVTVEFDYRLSDGNTFDTATVIMTINGTNDRPEVASINIGTTLVSENFESGATLWNNNTTDTSGTELTNFLGRFDKDTGEVSKTFALGAEHAGETVTIAFDMYEIDSWDGESFNVDVNDVPVSSDRMWYDSRDSNNDGGTETSGNIFTAWGSEDIHHYSLTAVVDGNGNIKLGFSSTLNQDVSDESWGIDNVTIVSNHLIYEAVNGNTTYSDVLPTVMDADVNDTHVYEINTTTVSVDNPLITGLITVTLDDVTTGAYTMSGDFNVLAVGETATVTFQYRADDLTVPTGSEESNYSEYETVTLTITGTNDAPIATNDTATPTIETTLLSESFESLRSADGYNIITSATVDGDNGSAWSVVNGLEVQQGIVATSSDGTSHVELDASSNSTISTTIDTSSQDSVRIEFDYNPRQDNPSSDMKFSFNGTEYDISHSGTISPSDNVSITGPDANGWYTVTGEFDVSGNSATLSFAGAGASDGMGALLDNIQVVGTSGGVSFETNEDTALVLDAATLLANDTDVDSNDVLTIGSVQAGENGTVVLSGNHSTVTFTPDADYNGPASFTYTVSDGNSGSDTATVNLNIAPVDDAAVVSLVHDAIVPELTNINIAAANFSEGFVFRADVQLTDGSNTFFRQADSGADSFLIEFGSQGMGNVNGNYIQVYIPTVGGVVSYEGNTPLDLNTWTNIEVQYDSTGVSISLDGGAPMGTTSHGPSSFPEMTTITDANYTIGDQPSISEYFNGQVSNVTIETLADNAVVYNSGDETLSIFDVDGGSLDLSGITTAQSLDSIVLQDTVELNLTVADVFDTTDGDHTLTITGDATSNVNIDTPAVQGGSNEWTQTTNGGAGGVDVFEASYNNETVILNIDHDITTVI